MVEKGLERESDDVIVGVKAEGLKLFLKVNATKTKVVRPTRSKYLGFTFLKNGGKWKVKPTNEKKKALKTKLTEYLNIKYKDGFNHEDIFKVANSRLGWYRRSGMNVVNYIISKDKGLSRFAKSLIILSE